jgi:hypothetical protein
MAPCFDYLLHEAVLIVNSFLGNGVVRAGCFEALMVKFTIATFAWVDGGLIG